MFRRVLRVPLAVSLIVAFGIGPGAGLADSSVASPVSASTSGLSFSPPITALTREGTPDSVSCASASDCLAGDRFGNVASFNGRKWTRPERIFSGRSVSVSCASTSLCVAVDGDRARVDSGTQWGAAKRIDTSSIAGVACAPNDFCAALDARGDVAFYKAGHWTNPKPTGVTGTGAGQSSAAGISCTSSTFCQVVVARTKKSPSAAVYDGMTWTAVTQPGVRRISCTSSTNCLGVGYDGRGVPVFATWDGSWSSTAKIATGRHTWRLAGLACASADYCVDTGDGQSIHLYDGTTWTTTETPTDGGAPDAVSCLASGDCVLVTGNGQGYVLNGSSLAKRLLFDPFAGGLLDLSCASKSDCVSTDQDGNLIRFNGSQWSRPARLGAGVGLMPDISCPTTNFCAGVAYNGVNDNGHIDFVQGHSATKTDAPEHMVSVSCTSKSFCMAVDPKSKLKGAAVYNGQTWRSVPNFTGRGADFPAADVSCSSAHFCVEAIQTSHDDDARNDHALTAFWNGTAWTKSKTFVTGESFSISCDPAKFCVLTDAYSGYTLADGTWDRDLAGEWNTASCVGRTFCLATGHHGRVASWDGSAWSSVSHISNAGLLGVDCLTASDCVVLSGAGPVASSYVGGRPSA